jgi:hypothetical protein
MIPLLACGLTVAAETLFFLALGYRSRAFLLLCAAANAATNLSLYLGLRLLHAHGGNIPFGFTPGAAAVLAEYGVYALLEGGSRRLLLLTLLANCLSYGRESSSSVMFDDACRPIGIPISLSIKHAAGQHRLPEREEFPFGQTVLSSGIHRERNPPPQVLFSKLVPHWRQMIRTLPFPRGTRIIALQPGHL